MLIGEVGGFCPLEDHTCNNSPASILSLPTWGYPSKVAYGVLQVQLAPPPLSATCATQSWPTECSQCSRCAPLTQGVVAAQSGSGTGGGLRPVKLTPSALVCAGVWADITVTHPLVPSLRSCPAPTVRLFDIPPHSPGPIQHGQTRLELSLQSAWCMATLVVWRVQVPVPRRVASSLVPLAQALYISARAGPCSKINGGVLVRIHSRRVPGF
ncbi:hypothetical protein XELAEV_18033645mg [Xenopus laevis]|uniref:Uncharacterized protein n=1 Tax=Xenopus laevis TaxID=8355 RepID=A0A974HE78_XENLA|nr:hypothetical protein XELAEV_18033645mg [Xenopus laevis]